MAPPPFRRGDGREPSPDDRQVAIRRRTTGRHRIPAENRAWHARFGVRAKLLALVGVTTLSLVAAIVADMYLRSAAAQEAMNDRAQGLARQVAAAVDARLETVEGVMIALGETVPFGAGSLGSDSILRGAVRHVPGVTLSAWTPMGHLIATGAPERHRGTAGPDVAAAASGRLAFGPLVRRPPGGPTVSFSMPAVGPDGRTRGVVSSSVELTSLLPLLTIPGLPPGSVVTLVARDGTVLARTADAAHWVGRRMLQTPEGVRIRALGTGVERVLSADGQERLSAFTTTRSAPWQVFVGIPAGFATASARSEWLRTGVVGAGIVALTLWLAWLVSVRITGPMRALAATAREFGRGDLRRRVAVTGSDDIGALGAAFNQMADALSDNSDALRASEIRHRAIFEMSPLAMLVYDPVTLRILAANQAMVRQYGYSRDELLELRITDLTPESQRLEVETYVATGLQGRRSRLWPHVRRDGEAIDVQVTSDDTLLDGAPARVVIAEDVSPRVAAERALRDSEERVRLAQRMEAVGQLAGGIAHDFNNLLTIIGTSVDLARQALPVDSGVAADLREARAAADRAAVLTRQLLAFSRRQVLQPRPVSLGDIVSGIEAMLRRLFDPSVNVRVELDDENALTHADAGAMEQVITNLVLNARDAMPAGGELTITTGEVSLARALEHAHGSVPAGRYVTVAVRDTGEGMPPHTLARMFEPFFTTKDVGRGTGLGLSMAHGIVHQSGGTLRVESVPGRGTTVTMYLPRAACDERGDPAVPAPDMATPAVLCTVLLVEDEGGVRAVASRILERAGHRVVPVTCAEEALAAVAAGKLGDGPALVLTDLIMPGTGGRALGEELARTHPGLPVLYMSGYTQDELFHRGVLAEQLPFLRKPFTAVELTEAVEQAVPGAVAAVLA